MRRDLGTTRLLALFGAGALLFHDPLLRLWDRAGTVFGLPFAPVALFVLWALLIGALALLMERDEGADVPAAGEPPPPADDDDAPRRAG